MVQNMENTVVLSVQNMENMVVLSVQNMENTDLPLVQNPKNTAVFIVESTVALIFEDPENTEATGQGEQAVKNWAPVHG